MTGNMYHGTQGERYALPVDFRIDVLNSMLQDSRFTAWKDIKRTWQLHISAGPGSGKSTLASLIARELRTENTSPVVHVHVHDDISSQAGAETSLQGPVPADDAKASESKFLTGDGKLRAGVINVSSLGRDFKNLCEVLSKQLYTSETIYLVVDGHDRAPSLSQDQLQQDLRQLQRKGLRVLLLQAACELEPFPPASPVTCDCCEHGSGNQARLYIYWTCQICNYDLCDPCKATGKHCHDRDHSVNEPYDVVSMKLTISESELEHFVRVDLKTEYGTEVEDSVIEAICEPSDGNINLVKLRLDQIRDLDVPSDILIPVDRLPREVVAFFDAEIKRIGVLDPTQRYQTLLALIAVAANKGLGMPVSTLEQLLSWASGSGYDSDGTDYPLVRRALKSARGLLSSIYFTGDAGSDLERHAVVPYIRDLGWYIREDYNQDLVLAKQYFIQAMKGERTLDRSYSFEQTTAKRNEEADRSGDRMCKDLIAEGQVSELSSMSIVDLILQEPGDICAACLEEMFRSTSNSGLRTWSKQDQKGSCPICLYAYKEMEGRSLGVLQLHWSRRTMGRTANSNSHLVLTLRIDDQVTRPVFRRFVFLLRSELGTIARSTCLGESTTLRDTGEQINKWLHTCNSEHVKCNQYKSDYVPKRLVDIGNPGGGENPEHYRVVLTHGKMDEPYVTLSHSWGPKPDFLTLTTDNSYKLTNDGFSSKELRNKNFEEAIKVARHLKVRYIWIDSLCICQRGSEGDFKEQGQYMHLVYQNSYCNIVAAASRDGSGGLFRDRPSVSLSGTNTTGSWIVLDKELWTKELLQSPIYTRGWVFQERMLSPRILHFTRSQVFWDCSTLSACETLPEGLPFALSALATTDRRWRGRLQRKNSAQDESSLAVEDSLETFWKTAVLNYTSCNLTNQADKTFAIWSVAKLVRDSLELADQYGCGLWSIALHEQLAWQVKVTRQDARMDTLLPDFPSWSWASVNAPIQIQDRIVAKRCYTIKNHEGAPISFSDFENKAENRNKQPIFAASDSLAIHGYLVPGQLRRDHNGGAPTFESAEAGLTLEYKVILDEEPTEVVFSTSSLHLLPLVAHKAHDDEATYTGNALVLIRTEDYSPRVQAKRLQQESRFKLLHKSPYREGEDTTHYEPELLTLYYNIKALRAYTDKVAKKDRELPSREKKAFRRVGVVRFDSLDADVWEKITKKKEEMIWLD